MTDTPATSASPPPWPLLVLLAWAVPGLGHFVAGERKRGLIIGVTLLSLFGAGLVVGGVSVIDSREDTLWFSGQLFAGPATVAFDRWHQSLKRKLGAQVERHAMELHQQTGRSFSEAGALLHLLKQPDIVPAYRKSTGRVNELGTLYCTLAGVLNLLAILDVIGRGGGAAPTGNGTQRGRLALRPGAGDAP